MTRRIIKALACVSTGALTLFSVCGPIHAQTRKSPPAKPTARKYPPGPEGTGMKFYQSEVHYAKLGLDVRVNDIPIVSDHGESGGGGGGRLLNMFLLDEPNHVTITLHPARGAAVPPVGAFAVVNVNAFGRERTSKPEAVYHYEWRQTTPPKELPHTISGTLPPVARSRPLSWQAAPRVTLDAHSEAAIGILLRRYHDALAAKDLTQVQALLTTSTQDMALALGRSASDTEAGQRRRYGAEFGNPSWRMKPMDYTHLRYHVCGNGRLISVEKPDGSPPWRPRRTRTARLPISTSASPFSTASGHWYCEELKLGE